MIRLAAFLFIVLCTAPALSGAATFPEKPPDTDFFVDQSALIRLEERTQINELASGLLTEERVPIYVVTIRSLAGQDAAGMSIEQYARELFDHWGIGFTDRNNGMLLVVSAGDRKARIELGEDWAHRHDTAAKSIMDDLIIPKFKQDNYSLGILDGVRGMEAMARGLDLPRPTAPWWFWPALILGLVGVIFLIVNLFRTGRKGWAWAVILALVAVLFFALRAAASSGGSGGGFGGGSGGGGGATGSW
jgi:uncharacterized protein